MEQSCSLKGKTGDKYGSNQRIGKTTVGKFFSVLFLYQTVDQKWEKRGGEADFLKVRFKEKLEKASN